MITWKKHFLYQVDYQHWANDILFASLDHLDDAARRSPQGLFFENVHKTVEHLLLENRNWMARLRQEPPPAQDRARDGEWKDLKNALRLDMRDMQRWLDAQPDSFFDQRLSYLATNNQSHSAWVRDILTHIMTHMAHHRGQLSAVATRLGAPMPEMDFITYRREMGEHLEHIRQQQ